MPVVNTGFLRDQTRPYVRYHGRHTHVMLLVVNFMATFASAVVDFNGANYFELNHLSY